MQSGMTVQSGTMSYKWTFGLLYFQKIPGKRAKKILEFEKKSGKKIRIGFATQVFYKTFEPLLNLFSRRMLD